MTPQANLTIQDQPRLPIVKQLEICADGIHHRLFRSLVTLSVVVLAIAFLMNVLTESAMVRSLRAGVEAKRAAQQERAAQGADAADTRRLLDELARPGLAKAWSKNFGGLFDSAQALARLEGDASAAAWLAQQAAKADPKSAPDAATLQRAAGRLMEARRLSDLAENLAADYGKARPAGEPDSKAQRLPSLGGSGGSSGGMFWLIVVSFLVCVVGIANALIVSVVERFREIATMKCLGALDGFIATLFLLESAFLGIVGGAIGVALGLAVGVLRMALAYGHWVFEFFPWSGVLGAAGLSLLAGAALAVLAAIYPAYLASRMPPMEAMRVE